MGHWENHSVWYKPTDITPGTLDSNLLIFLLFVLLILRLWWWITKWVYSCRNFLICAGCTNFTSEMVNQWSGEGKKYLGNVTPAAERLLGLRDSNMRAESVISSMMSSFSCATKHHPMQALVIANFLQLTWFLSFMILFLFNLDKPIAIHRPWILHLNGWFVLLLLLIFFPISLDGVLGNPFLCLI